MPSTLELIRLLEPSNLLEPLDLTKQNDGSDSRSAKRDYGTSRTVFTPTIPRKPASVPVRQGGRRRVKSVFIVAGALGCFAAGTALSQLTAMVGDINPSQSAPRVNASPTAGALTQPTAQVAGVAIEAAASKPLAPPDDSKPAATSSASKPASASAGLQPTAASVESKPAATSNSANQHARPAANEAIAGAAMPCHREAARKDDCLEGAAAPVVLNSPPAARPVPQGGTPQVGTSEAGLRPSANPARASRQQRVSGQREDGGRSSGKSRRELGRETADQRPPTDGSVPSARSSVRRDDRGPNQTLGWRRDWFTADNTSATRRDDRDPNQTSGWRRDWDDSAPAVRTWDRRDEWDPNREANWGRNRSEGYGRGDDHRAVGRLWREDDRMIRRTPRLEGQMMIVPPFRNGW
jgi:hypothetical protein